MEAPFILMGAETELELQRAVGRVEGKLDALIDEVRAANSRHTSVGAALSKRINKVEKWQTRLIATGVGVGATITFIFRYILN